MLNYYHGSEPPKISFDDGYEIRRHAAAGQLASIPGDVGDDLMHRIETHGEIVIDKATARASEATASTPSKPSPPSSTSTSTTPTWGDCEHLPRHLSLEQER